jgi:predicted oxidoreductase
LQGLAAKLGIDPAAFAQTVKIFNENAADGRDPEFMKGNNAYERAVGDPTHKPHPNLRPLGPGPFYGVRVVPADVGTFAGLRVDASARVLGRDGAPVRGLYAVGADMANIFGGHSPGGGTTLGPALTFGYIIGRDLGRERNRT